MATNTKKARVLGIVVTSQLLYEDGATGEAHLGSKAMIDYAFRQEADADGKVRAAIGEDITRLIRRGQEVMDVLNGGEKEQL